MTTKFNEGGRVRFTTYAYTTPKTLRGKVVRSYEMEWRWHFLTTVVEILGDDGNGYHVNAERVFHV